MLPAARHALGALCLGFVLGAVRTSHAAPAEAVRDIWVEVRINKVSQPDFALVHVDLRGHLFARVEDMRAWHMTLPGSAMAGGLVRVDDVPGLHARLDEDGMVLLMDADPAVFAAQVVSGNRSGDKGPETGMPALFMNYNLFAERDGGSGQTYSALALAGASFGRASLTSSWLDTRIVDAPLVAGENNDGQSGLHRLDTDLLLDFPEVTARLTLGDSVTSPGTLGQSVRFTGVHWATDYTTRPGLTPYALPVVSGTATLPSSIELFVNQMLVQRTTVDAGPFELNNIPVPVGEGAVQIRMRDILGQEQQLAVPYLVTPQLIAVGLTTFDFAAGSVRKDYGIENFAYGQSFLSSGVQHGLSDVVTLNGSGEFAPDSSEVTARGGAAARLTRNMTIEITPAVSHAAVYGTGGAVDTGIDTLWSSTALSVHFRGASPSFVELGNLTLGERLHTEWAAQASTQFGHFGSLGLVYARRRSYDAPATAAATLTYNLSVRGLGSIGAFVSNARSGGVADIIGGITFTRYLGKGVTTSVTETVDDGASTVELQLGKPAPPDAGWGWELAHARGGTDTDGIRIDARSAYGTGSGEVDSTQSGTLGILAWQGGFLWAGGRPWPAQTLSGPAALVEVPDLGGVEILHDGQPVGRTDSQGRILVPALRPFEDNTITAVPEDLPLTAMLDSNRLVVRPYSHGVLSAVMPVSGGDSRVFSLHLAHGSSDRAASEEIPSGDGLAPGEFVPAGAEVTLSGHTFPVGTQGIAQLPVTRAPAAAVVSWPGGSCRVHVPGLPALPGAGDGAGPGDGGGGPLVVECRL